MSRNTLSRRRLCITGSAAIGAVTLPGKLSAQSPSASPASSGTRIYVAHLARLITRIPSDWQPSSRYAYAYEGSGGAIMSNNMFGESFDEAIAHLEQSTGIGSFNRDGAREITVGGQPAYLLPNAFRAGFASTAVAIITVPTPLQSVGQTWNYGVLYIEGDQVDAILDAVTFDTATLSGADYAASVLDTIGSMGVFRDSLDVDALREDAGSLDDLDAAHAWFEATLVSALNDAGDALAETGPLEGFQLAKLGATPEAGQLASELPTGEVVADGIGYIRLPDCASLDGPAFARAAFDLLVSQADVGCQAWIVDVRGLSRNWLSTTMAVLQPFYQDDQVIGFDYGAQGVQMIPNEVFQSFIPASDPEFAYPEIPAASIAPVAVLMSDTTREDGEAAVITLLTRENTRTFGSPTAGRAMMSDGAVLIDDWVMSFAVALFADGNQESYPEGISPDVAIDGSSAATSDPNDPVVAAASDWLGEQVAGGTPVASPAS